MKETVIKLPASSCIHMYFCHTLVQFKMTNTSKFGDNGAYKLSDKVVFLHLCKAENENRPRISAVFPTEAQRARSEPRRKAKSNSDKAVQREDLQQMHPHHYAGDRLDSGE